MPASVPLSVQRQPSPSGLLHILSTSPLSGSEVLVSFSDGSSAIYELEELEKLRPTAKKVFPAQTAVQPRRFAEVA